MPERPRAIQPRESESDDFDSLFQNKRSSNKIKTDFKEINHQNNLQIVNQPGLESMSSQGHSIYDNFLDRIFKENDSRKGI
jgi:hypothetical protein